MLSVDLTETNFTVTALASFRGSLLAGCLVQPILVTQSLSFSLAYLPIQLHRALSFGLAPARSPAR